MKKFIFGVISSHILFFWLSCVVAQTSKPATKKQEVAKYQSFPVLHGGTVKGEVKIAGDYPKPEKIKVTKDQDVCGSQKISEKFILSKENKGLKNVVVRLKNITKGKVRLSDKQLVIEQHSCSYIPHLQAALIGPAGIDVEIRNSDGILHNVHAYQEEQTLFNVAQPGSIKKFIKHIDNPGTVTLKCDVHEWMNAYIILLTNPYFDITDEKGQYAIPDIPPGKYIVEAWHEGVSALEKEIVVPKDGETILNFDMAPSK